MYEERKDSISLRDLAIQLLFIVLFILILLWIFPTKKNMKDYVKENKGNKPAINETVEKNKENNSTVKEPVEENKGNNSTEKKYSYEYVLASDEGFGEYGNWSEWSTKKVIGSDTVEVETEVRNIQTGAKSTTVQIGTKEETYLLGTVTDNKGIVGYKTEKYIASYKTEKVKVGEEKVQTGTTTQTIIEKYISGYADVYEKTESGTYVPADNSKYKYKQTGVKKERPCGSCPEIVTYTYNVYKVTPVYSTREIKKTVPVYEIRDVYETRQVPVYATRQVPIYDKTVTEKYATRQIPIYDTKLEPIYSSVTYYRYRECTYKGVKQDIKWSNSNSDSNLINQGYKLTGNVKEN